MRNKLILCIAAFCGLTLLSLSAQAPARTECRTITGPDFVAYQQSLDQDDYKQAIRRYLKSEERAAIVQYAVQIHIVRQDNGSTSVTIEEIRDEFENWINPYFAAIDIEFVECAPEKYWDNTDYYFLGDGDNDGDVEGDAMSVAYNVPDVINIYYVGDADGACGWARFPWKLPSDYIVIDNGCADNQSTTVHELGHYFGLLHTHETANGKESVTRDDSDGCWNCETAGDLLCDTPADPNISDKANDWPSCAYTGTGTDDCNDDPYSPMIDNIMSYADKECRVIFTPEQNARMEFYRDGDRSYLQTGCPCEKPVASCQDITVNLDSDGNASIAFGDVDNGSTYDCGLASATVSPDQFDCFDAGVNVVTLTIVDDLGWESSCTADVTIADITDPSLTTAASDMTVECDGGGNQVQFNNWLSNNGGAVAADACGGSWSNNSSGLSDGCGATGAETVTFTYTDPSGNSVSTMATFSVVDLTAPSVTCPDDIHLPECVPTASWVVIASDVCGGVAVVSNPPSGSTFPKGTTTTVEVTVTDDCGNVSTCSFDVTRDPDLEVEIDPVETSDLPTCAAGTGANIVLGYGGGPTCVTFNATASGGHAPYTYAWEGPEGLPSGSFVDANTANPTFCADFQTAPCVTYEFEVTTTDIHGCTETSTVSINVVNPLCTDGPNPKVNVCHYPAEDPTNEQTICVGSKSVPHHLNHHGDCLGACDDVCVMFEAEMLVVESIPGVERPNPHGLTAVPNPFSSNTTLFFRATSSSHVQLAIYDFTGKVVAMVHDGPVEVDVEYNFEFNGANMPAGIYIARMVTDTGDSESVKMLLVH